ncbi:SusD family protein [Olivibacter domesticus]|uniref:SusD family protein n=2 Tax=Olivibacter domesticus TaxID=407022 RepID=A0A1H7JMF8_OLID1|nr:SusD family protein [Olivibacter domesticus]
MLLAISILFGCQKDFLDIKSDKKLVVPTNLKDLQSLLDNTERMNILMPYLTEISADDYYVRADRYQSLSSLTMKSAYVWAKDFVYQNNSSSDWDWRYEQVFLANLALEGLDKIERNSNNAKDWNNIKGSALFYRSWAFYQLSQLFCKPYDSTTANTDLGIPLKRESDINEKVFRATVKETYEQMLNDLSEAIDLLPTVSNPKTRPSKAAAHAFLARLHLLMGNYANAAEHAAASITLADKLMNFNDLDATANYPVPQFNDEVIFHSSMLGALILRENRLIVDSVLFDSYQADDLRKKIFFYYDGENRYKGSYDGTRELFTGLASDEVYLILAECYARLGMTGNAIELMTTLLENRYAKGTDLSLGTLNQEQLLYNIIAERRKELVFRGLRWTDLRRLNKETAFKVTLKRELNGVQYELLPNENSYVLPIPPNIIAINGIEQNER